VDVSPPALGDGPSTRRAASALVLAIVCLSLAVSWLTGSPPALVERTALVPTAPPTAVVPATPTEPPPATTAPPSATPTRTATPTATATRSPTPTSTTVPPTATQPPPTPTSTPAPPTPAPPAPPPPPTARTVRIIRDAQSKPALLREAPTVQARVIGEVPADAVVEVLGTQNGDAVVAGNPVWYRVSFNGQVGYVYAALAAPTG
jgi:hypothetical protein